jgi:Sulfotransferase family
VKDNQENIQVAWISGMPRSGTTWLSQIFASSPDVRLKSCPLFSYEFKNSLDENSTAEQWDKLFAEVYRTNSEYLDQEHLRKHGLIPRFENKHANPRHLIIKSNRFHNLTPLILKLNERVRFIYIVRHPCATIYSWLSDEREFPAQFSPLEQWRNGQCRKTGPGEFWGFDDWKKVTSQALKLSRQYPDRHRIVRYEDLVRNPELQAKKLFRYLQIPFDEQTRDFIALSQGRHDAHKHSVFKNPELRDRWEDKLDASIITACMNEIRGTELEQFASG